MIITTLESKYLCRCCSCKCWEWVGLAGRTLCCRTVIVFESKCTENALLKPKIAIIQFQKGFIKFDTFCCCFLCCRLFVYLFEQASNSSNPETISSIMKKKVEIAKDIHWHMWIFLIFAMWNFFAIWGGKFNWNQLMDL